jgi:hypothetical protein
LTEWEVIVSKLLERFQTNFKKEKIKERKKLKENNNIQIFFFDFFENSFFKK